jgi:hypothetical protein
MISSFNSAPALYDMKAAAESLNIPKIGSINLYWHLKRLGITDRSNVPNKQYLEFGFFTIGLGTKNLTSPRLYPKTLVTQTGLTWLQEAIAPAIRSFNSKSLKK